MPKSVPSLREPLRNPRSERRPPKNKESRGGKSSRSNPSESIMSISNVLTVHQAKKMNSSASKMTNLQVTKAVTPLQSSFPAMTSLRSLVALMRKPIQEKCRMQPCGLCKVHSYRSWRLCARNYRQKYLMRRKSTLIICSTQNKV